MANLDLIGLLLIFFARVLDVSCGTMRILFLVRGKRAIAAFIGFFEVIIYMAVLGKILGGGKVLTFTELVFYCGGFATGNYVGSFLEEKFMNTQALAEVILNDSPEGEAIVKELRENGLGATVLKAEGRSGGKLLVEIFCRRNDLLLINKIVGNNGFVTMSDVRKAYGGWFPKRK